MAHQDKSLVMEHDKANLEGGCQVQAIAPNDKLPASRSPILIDRERHA